MPEDDRVAVNRGQVALWGLVTVLLLHGACVPVGACANDVDCPEGMRCADGTCTQLVQLPSTMGSTGGGSTGGASSSWLGPGIHNPSCNDPPDGGPLLPPSYGLHVALGGRSADSPPITCTGGLLDGHGAQLCWGQDQRDLLGQGGVPSHVGIPLACLAPDAILGDHHACGWSAATLDEGTRVCWGDNTGGRLNPALDAGWIAPDQGVRMLRWEVEHVALTASATCRSSRVSVEDAGPDQLHRVACTGQGAEVTQAPGLIPVIRMAAGADHVCVTSTTHVTCWGANTHGQCGDTPAGATVTSLLLPDTQQLALGDGFTCARSRSGAVRCWGRNDLGQLGHAGPGGGTPTLVHHEDGTPLRAVHVAAGAAHACAVDVENVTWCWGNNSHGQTGQPDVGAPTWFPRRVDGFPAGVSVQLISGGPRHTCMVLGPFPETLACMGDNAHGELGVPPEEVLFTHLPVNPW